MLPYELFRRVQHDLAQARLLADSELMEAIDGFHADPAAAVKVSRHHSRDKRKMAELDWEQSAGVAYGQVRRRTRPTAWPCRPITGRA